MSGWQLADRCLSLPCRLCDVPPADLLLAHDAFAVLCTACNLCTRLDECDKWGLRVQAARQERALRRDRQRQKRLKEAGIDYEYQPLAEALPAKPSRVTFDEE